MHLEDFIKAGVKPELIVEAKQPSVIWSLSKKQILDVQRSADAYELITDENGNSRITFENNRRVNVASYDGLSKEIVEQINASAGIIVYCEDDIVENLESFKTKSKFSASSVLNLFKDKQTEPVTEVKRVNSNYFRFQFIPTI